MKKQSIWKSLFRLSILLVGTWYICVYGYLALLRSRAIHCERDTNGKYIAERCMLRPEFWAVFRLYDAQTGELLVERNYDDPLMSAPIWEDNRIAYDLSAKDGEGFVMLPPSWLDRLRAKLP